MVEQPGELHLLFSGIIEQRHGEYIVTIPEEEVKRGVLDVGDGYKFGVFDDEANAPKSAGATLDTGAATEDDALTGDQDGEKQSTRTAERDSWTRKSPSSRNGDETPVSKGEMLDVTIEALGEKGDGIAKVGEGYVIIVPETEPGDDVTVEIDQVQANVAFASVIAESSSY